MSSLFAAIYLFAYFFLPGLLLEEFLLEKAFKKRKGLCFLMNVRDIMVRKVITIDKEASVRKACRKMTREKVGSLLITDNGSAIGIVTERDVIRKVVQSGKDSEIMLIKRIMSTPLVVISPAATLELAVDTMIENRIKKLPVISDDSELIGIVSATDIIANNPKYLKKVAALIMHGVDAVGG